MIRGKPPKRTHSRSHERGVSNRGSIAKVRAPAAPMGLSFDSVDGDRPGTRGSGVCPRPTGTTSLSCLTIIDGWARGKPLFL
jgi:hypothetical protein